jgi:Glycine-zipper domain
MKCNLRSGILGVAIMAWSAFAQNPATRPAQQQPSAAPATPQPRQKTTAQILTDLGVFVYPKKKQSKAQQGKDASACLAWTEEQTGIDPAAPIQAQTAAAAPQSAEQQKTKKPKGGGVKGAAGGAAGGAVIGAIAGDAGTGAAIGATTGAVVGRRRQKKAEKAAKQQAEAQAEAARKEQAEAAEKRTAEIKDAQRKAFSACMEARGYSVK